MCSTVSRSSKFSKFTPLTSLQVSVQKFEKLFKSFQTGFFFPFIKKNKSKTLVKLTWQTRCRGDDFCKKSCCRRTAVNELTDKGTFYHRFR